MNKIQLTVKPITPHLGATVTGFDLAQKTFEQDQVSLIKELFAKHQLLIFKDKILSPMEQIRFTQLFGALETFPYQPTQFKAHPEIFRLSNHSNDGYSNVGFYWHQDGSFRETPSYVSAFHLVKVPTTGGATLFANAYAAYEKIPAHLHAIANKVKTVHTGNILHDLVIEHPITKRKALYMNMGLVKSFTGFDESEKALMQELSDQLQSILDHPEVMVNHQWQEGDFILCDNYSVLHQATEVSPSEHRVLHRTTVAGTLNLNR